MSVPGIQKVLCAGNIVTDILVRSVDRLQWSTTTWVDSIDQFLGGNGANTAFTLARFGVPVRLLGYAGTDAFGDFATGHLESAGVDVSQVVRTPEKTAVTVGLVNSGGDRMFLHRGGASIAAFPDPIDFPAALPASGFTHFHLANLFGLPLLRKHAAVTLERARAAGLTTSLDTGWDSQGRWMDDLAACLPQATILFVNENESEHLTGCKDPERAARALHKQGAETVVTKLGAKGCRVLGAKSDFACPGFRIDPVDTTGAGDCFAGGFLAALHRGATLEEAARFANAAGALSTSALGAVSGLAGLDYAAVLRWVQAAG